MPIARTLLPLRPWAVLLAVLAALWPRLATAEPPVWRIHGRGGSEIVLFGSVHLLTPGLDWRTAAVRDALAHAQSLWLETPLDPPAAAAARRTAQANSRLPPGQTLSALLSPTGRGRLAKVAKSLGLDASGLEPLRPWFAELTLTLVQVQAQGGDQGDGVEQSLLREAPARLPRRWFETPEEQVRYLADAPIPEQLASLEESLKEMEEDPDAFAELQRAWLAGDTGWIEREAIQPLRREAPGVYERVVAARNRRWAERIETLLKGKERAFVVVGVGHLIGPDSVPALLRRRGIAVEGP